MKIFSNIGQFARSGIGSLWTNISMAFNKIGWKASITFIIVLIIFGSSIITAVSEGRPKVLVDEIFGRVIQADTSIGLEAQNLVEVQASQGILDKATITASKIKSVAFIAGALWFMFLMLYVLKSVVMYGLLWNDSMTSSSWAIAIILFIVIQAWVTSLSYNESIDDMRHDFLLSKYVPFQGTTFFIKQIPSVLGFAKENVVDKVKPYNSTIMEDSI